MIYTRNAKLVTLLVLATILFVYSCGDDNGVDPEDALTISCPPDTVVPINLSSPVQIGVYPSVTSTCMDNPTVTTRDSFPQVGGLIRIWEVSDTCGNTESCMQTIGLGAPFYHTLTIECPADTVVPINLSSPEQIGVYPVVTSTCMDDPVVTTRDSVPDGMTGGLKRIWEVTDTCGNTESCVQSIGLGAPFIHTLTIECPPDTVVPMGESDPEQIGVYPVVTSTCMDNPPVTSRDSIPDGMVGGFIRIWETSDTCGNSESCLQSVGLGPPFIHTLTIECPNDTIVPINQSSAEEIGVYPLVTSTCMDDPGVTSRDSVPDGMVGGFIRIWETSDTCGNSESCLQSVGLGPPE